MELNCCWFMAVDFRGNWVLTKGRACINTFDDSNDISGFLCLGESPKTEIYAQFSGHVTEDNVVTMVVSSEEEGVPSFEVSGSIYSLGIEDEIAHTFVLTDGTTVLGFSALR